MQTLLCHVGVKKIILSIVEIHFNVGFYKAPAVAIQKTHFDYNSNSCVYLVCPFVAICVQWICNSTDRLKGK